MDLNELIQNLHNNLELQALVGEYKGFPAIGNLFDAEPDESYITICEIEQPNYRECPDGALIQGSVRLDIKIVLEKCRKKSEIRDLFQDMYCILRKYTDTTVVSFEMLDSSSTLLSNNQRPYIASTWRVHFR